MGLHLAKLSLWDCTCSWSLGAFCLSCLIGGAIDNDIFDLFLNFSSLRGDKVPTSCQILMYSSAVAVEFFEAIAHFPGNIIGNFPNSAISLQGTTRDIRGISVLSITPASAGGISE